MSDGVDKITYRFPLSKVGETFRVAQIGTSGKIIFNMDE